MFAKVEVSYSLYIHVAMNPLVNSTCGLVDRDDCANRGEDPPTCHDSPAGEMQEYDEAKIQAVQCQGGNASPATRGENGQLLRCQQRYLASSVPPRMIGP